MIPTQRRAYVIAYVIACVIAVSASPATGAAPIDEFRISDIEQQIRDLQTSVREQARMINELQQKIDRQLATNSTTPPAATTTSADSPAAAPWLNARNWQQLKPGMNELQVVALLGAPTQTRRTETADGRQLLYAMEIGRSGFLSGKVTMIAGQLSSFELPTLK